MMKKMDNMSHRDFVEKINEKSCDALVIFCDSSSLWWLKLLKKGYRHCFVAVSSDNDWIIYEPLLKRTELSLIKKSSIEEIRRCFESMGCKVIPTRMNRTKPIRRNLLAPFTCVRAVEKLLGISPRWVFTPNQLYKYLSKGKNI